MRFFYFLQFFLVFSSFADDFVCCGETYEVKVKDTSGGTIRFCQYDRGGTVVKDGNYKRQDANGKPTKLYFYNNDEIIRYDFNITSCKEAVSARQKGGSSHVLPKKEKSDPSKNRAKKTEVVVAELELNEENYGIIATMECPTDALNEKIQKLLGKYPKFDKGESCSYKKGYDLIVQREMFWNEEPHDYMIRQRPCLEWVLKYHAIAYRVLVYMNSAEHCYLMENNPDLIRLKENSDAFRYQFYGQPWVPKSKMGDYPKHEKGKMLIKEMKSFENALSESEQGMFKLANEAIDSYLSSLVAVPFRQKVEGYDNKLRSLLY